MIIQSGKEELQTRHSYPKWIRWPRGLHMRVHYKILSAYALRWSLMKS